MQVFYLNLEKTTLNSIIEEKYLGFLADDEKVRFYAIANQLNRRNFLFGRVLLRYSLAKIFNYNYQDIALVKGEAGRLELDSNLPFKTSFNLSHSKDVVILAIDDDKIGVDVEFIRKRNFDELANYFFSQSEVLDLQKLDKAESFDEITKWWNSLNVIPNYSAFESKLGLKVDLKPYLFYAYWTLKEAYVKCNAASIFNSNFALECCYKDGLIKTKKDNEYQFFTKLILENYIFSISSRSALNKSLKIQDLTKELFADLF